ncbi:hypothetical protein SAMN05660405_01109 [Psychrobacter pacificensis]|uniref:DUF4878 domain-containing protein n=1 Tax=Psychrobacter pacificensis TaxID=112002 RepID=A0A1G6WXK2_9GAMM|nr:MULTISPECIES: hypothetical protein [Psychrobacter]AOY44727.1 hypothetical protein AOT82_2348 [Psychrobacter sp. AntiMn-1]GLR29361.1 hypothetical protein GCM10007915_15990 [Psychrobacter pacificensis]SDD69907.1 hypothetical protein SAMN05660405_01109 [Psychrobacter pacificensis]
MTTKQPLFQRLPLLLATGVLGTGLLLSGCSNNESAVTETATNNEEVAAVVDTSDTDTAEQKETADSTSETTQVTDDTENTTTVDNDNINPVTAPINQKSLVTNPTEAGTPEDTVKKALNTLYYGDVKDAAGYYQVDMANFEQELANTQSAFQQTVDGVTITDTTYNDDKTRATITGELMLKGQSDPAPLTYQLQKIDGQWKILG